MSDVMSIFDVSTCGVVELRMFVWVRDFAFVALFAGMVFYINKGRAFVLFQSFLGLVQDMVDRSKLIALRGSRVLFGSLFLMMFFCNVVGLLPFVVRVSSHLVFRMCFGLRF